MARVYKGLDVSLKRTVVVKVMGEGLRSSEAYAQRFEREAQATASLCRPNIVSVFYFGNQDSLYYLVMEYIDGSRHFEGARFAYWTMEAGRRMEIVFADVSNPQRLDNCRPNAYFTPTRTQGVNFWTGSGQFRVLWNNVEIAVCDDTGGEGSVHVLPA